MTALLDFLLLLGGLAAAAAVGTMCLVVLFVWIGGGLNRDRTETWRQADKL